MWYHLVGVTYLVTVNLTLETAAKALQRQAFGRQSTSTDTTDHDILSVVNHQPNYIKKLYKEVVNANPSSAKIIHDYIIAEEAEVNIQESTKGDKIKKLCLLSRFFHHHKCFSEMAKSDLLAYLNSLRKSSDVDPTHRSIGTYNGRQMVFMKFFRWLYNSEEPDHRKRITPPCMIGVKILPRREKSPYRPEDIWTTEDHTIFLKYCPMARDRCWHSMVHDTSVRPHELLDLSIGDIKFKVSNNGIQFAVIHVRGKTKPRTLPLINSIPYVKEWLSVHPFGSNSDSKLIVSLGKRNYGQPLTRDGLLKHYQSYYRDVYFPKLVEDPKIPIKDKEAIRRILDKPWNLYIFRHSALTHKSQILKEATLRDHAGWTTNSKMPSVYLHYFGTESCNSLLETHGIITRDGKQASSLVSLYCPGCKEPNKPEAQFCKKCNLVLKYDVYSDLVQKEQQKDLELIRLSEKLEVVQEQQNQKFSEIMAMIRKNPKLSRLKHEVLMSRKPKKK